VRVVRLQRGASRIEFASDPVHQIASGLSVMLHTCEIVGELLDAVEAREEGNVWVRPASSNVEPRGARNREHPLTLRTTEIADIVHHTDARAILRAPRRLARRCGLGLSCGS
jgi:hypothetical protein